MRTIHPTNLLDMNETETNSFLDSTTEGESETFLFLIKFARQLAMVYLEVYNKPKTCF